MESLEFNATKAIEAAYDSVALINTIKAIQSPTQDDLDTLARNKKHIQIMLTKPEFVSALTSEQKTELTNAQL